jgi:replication initiation and membrane attachment protein DnaB
MNGHEEELRQLETMDPVEFLRQYTGEPVSGQLVQLIYELKKHYRFPNGVINGLMEYCLLQKNHKITRKFVTKLADELEKAGVKTGQESFALLKGRDLNQAEYREQTRTLHVTYNPEYVETNIALLARQLHDLRREIHSRLGQIDSRLERMEKQLKQLGNMLK